MRFAEKQKAILYGRPDILENSSLCSAYNGNGNFTNKYRINETDDNVAIIAIFLVVNNLFSLTCSLRFSDIKNSFLGEGTKKARGKPRGVINVPYNLFSSGLY